MPGSRSQNPALHTAQHFCVAMNHCKPSPLQHTIEDSIAMSESNSVEPILISEWISRAINKEVARASNSFVDPQPRILCSDDYLTSALRVALSLADWICKAEDNDDKILPMPSSDWSDGIIVNQLRQTANIEGMLVENGEQGNLIRAEFLPSLLNTNNTHGSNNDINPVQYIHSLGIVLYEIFSGGERPLELLKGERTTAVGSDELSADISNFDPIPLDQAAAAPIDFGNNINIIDDLLKGDVGEDEQDGQRLSKKRQTGQSRLNHTSSSISVEPLKAKWVPGPLCDLIANMLDSTNDALSGEESYKCMTDVRDDLQLMSEKPTIFLHDQDVGRLSITGLQFNNTVFGRSSELSAMKEAYRRSVSGAGELVIVSGVSGSGKSFLASEFGKYVSSDGGILLSGKFDQLEQGRPFSALASAFDTYCGKLMRKDGPLSMEDLASKLISSLGREVYHLARIMPNLAIILGPRVMVDFSNDQVCANPQERLQYLLCQFVEVLSSSYSAPVVLFLDDLQWADTASIDAVNQLLFTPDLSSSLSAKQGNRFFFLGCCREGGIDEQHPLWSVFCHAELLNVKYTNLQLRCFEENTLNSMVSETLCLPPRITQSLSSIIYHKTKGNPLFVSRLMLSLSKDGLLRPNLNRRRWEWDKEKIQSQKLPEDVAMFITSTIEALPEEVQSSICVLSCFGASAETAFIKTLEKALDRQLLGSLDIAVAEGLLDKIDDKYRFSHDRIQEAAYAIMNLLEQGCFHFNYGMALAPLATDEEDDSILLIAANQLNLARPEAVQEESQYAIVAGLNLKAGKKSMEMSDFVAAYSYFDHGISFLRKNHWEEHYALSLELFDLAARCALTNGDASSLNLLSQQVLEKAKSFEDKLSVMYYTMCALAASVKLPESIKRGLNILAKLGIYLRDCESKSVRDCLKETKELLSGYTDDEILNIKRMTDPTMIMAMKFLGKLGTGMLQIMPKSAPHVSQRIIQLSLTHGMSPVSPIGFVHFGSHIAKLGDISGGYHYVKLARSLLGKVSRENEGQVICFGTQVVAYVEPLQAILGYHHDGFTAAMASGNIFLSGTIAMMSSNHSFFAGENLTAVRERYDVAIKFMVERNQMILSVQTQFYQQSVLKLMGLDVTPTHASGENAILASNITVKLVHHFHRMYISFIFRSFDSAQESLEKYFACYFDGGTTLFLAHAFHAFYIGLISFWVARKSSEGLQWLERGKRSKLALKKWAESSQWSFENKWYLLEAEEAFSSNDFDAAKSFYDKAISSAKAHKVR